MISVVSILLLIGSTSCGELKAEHRQRETADSYYDDYYEDYVSKPQYSYSYAVKDPDNLNLHGHKQTRDGDSVKGQYVVLLPDGNKQIVQYEAGKFGYRAKVLNNHGSHEMLSEEYKQKYVHPYQQDPPLHSGNKDKRVGVVRPFYNKLHPYEPVSSTFPPIVFNPPRIQKHHPQNKPEQKYQKVKPDAVTIKASKTDISTATLHPIKGAAVAQSEILQPQYEVPIEIPETAPENSFPLLAQENPVLTLNGFPHRDPALAFRPLSFQQPLYTQVNPQQSLYTQVNPQQPLYTQVNPQQSLYTQVSPQQPLSFQQPLYTQVNPQPLKNVHRTPFVTRDFILQHQQPYLIENEVGIIRHPDEQFSLSDQLVENRNQLQSQRISTANKFFRGPGFEQPIYSISGTIHNPYSHPRFVDRSYTGAEALANENVFNYKRILGDGNVPTTTAYPYSPTTASSKAITKFRTHEPKQQFIALNPLYSDHEFRTFVDAKYNRQFPVSDVLDSRFIIPSHRVSFLLGTHNTRTSKPLPEFQVSNSGYFPINNHRYLSVEKPAQFKTIEPPLVVETPKTYSPPVFKSKN